MEYMSEERSQGRTTNTILCCQCGTVIEPNAANMCVACLRTQIDITEGIPKQTVIYFCRKCERYLQPPGTWIAAALESRELLAVCLKKLKGLNKVNLIDAGFVWTEPHSQRIKVKLTIQKEILNGAVLQQVFVVEYTVQNHQCDDCHRVEAKDFWRSVVQVRQKTVHRKTFYYLEQLILKHKAHVNTVNIKPSNNGLDFYYTNQDHARKFVDFLVTVVPCRYDTAKQLVSHDPHCNVYNYKTTFSVEIVPICKDNVVCLPGKLAQSLGGLNRVCICYKVTQSLHLIDPNTLQIAELSHTMFWRYPFSSICEVKHLIEYMVMEVEIVAEKDKPHRTPQSHKHVLADVWVARMSDLGSNDQQFHCRTHLGHLLKTGDVVLGFDMCNSNVNNAELEAIKTEKLPDVMNGSIGITHVLVKKVYGDKTKRNKNRKWKLKHLQDDMKLETASLERDYNDFLDDLEEDPTFRQNVNIYIDKSKIAIEADESDDECIHRISLQEMLDDLHIDDDPMGDENVEGAAAAMDAV